MSIPAVGLFTDHRVATAAAATPVAAASPRGAQTLLDESLPVTSQVPELEPLQQAVDTLNRHIPIAARDLLFSIDEDSGKVVVKIVDNITQDVIRQIPSAEALEISRSLDKLSGLLLRSKA